MVLAKRHIGSLDDFRPGDNALLADLLSRLTLRYDNLFETPFPYTMGFHQSPTDGASDPHWHFHGHFYPPLLRSATVRKFMVGSKCWDRRSATSRPKAPPIGCANCPTFTISLANRRSIETGARRQVKFFHDRKSFGDERRTNRRCPMDESGPEDRFE